MRKIRCFLVTECGANAEYLLDVPVLELGSYADSLTAEEKENIEVLIATPENVMADIEKSLDEQGLYCHMRLTSRRWAELMSFYYVLKKEYLPLSALPIGYHEADLHVFMSKFYKDKPLTGNYYIPEWVTPVQAGAVLCSERIADILDCDGENISEKNGNYSELTVLYWMWKNRLQNKKISGKMICEEMVSDGTSGAEAAVKKIAYERAVGGGIIDDRSEYYGLVHYRRILELSEDDELKLVDNDVDVVLPYPMPYEPDINEHHKRYLSDEDWEALLTALRELQPEYADELPAILEQRYLYNYNIIIARKNVLTDYCSWLFPILERAEQLTNPTGDRSDRYIGYMGETLETVYFMYNKDKLNVVHAGCIFYT